MLSDLKKAGRIARKVLNYAKSLIKPDVKVLEIVESIEQKIIDLGGYPAFPVNISINNIAAHYTPDINDDKIIKEGDIVKIDLGVHINGYIVDCAITVEVNDSKYKNLIKASQEALDNVRKILKKGLKLREIGSVIENTIKDYGFNPIYNLSGHKIEQYILHAGVTIPNYDNKSEVKIEEGIYAIEPFATNGIGYVRDGPGSKIYSIVNYRPIRDPKLRKFLEELYNKYKFLPFARRWLYREFNKKYNIDLAINLLKKYNIIYEYPILIEKSNGIVSQHETTFYISNRVYDLLSED